MLLINTQTVFAIGNNQQIEHGGPYVRQSKNPSVDAQGLFVLSVYTVQDVNSQQQNPNVWSVYLSGSWDIGLTWSPIGFLDQRTYPCSSNPQDYADIFIDQNSGRAHIVWQELIGNTWVIRYRWYDRPTNTWSPTIQTISTNSGSGNDAKYPKIAVAWPNDGNPNNRYINVVWQEQYVDPNTGTIQWEVMLRISINGGATWNTPTPVSTVDFGPSIHPVIGVDFDEFLTVEYIEIAWEEVCTWRVPTNLIFLQASTYMPGMLMFRFNTRIKPSTAEQTHPDITVDFGEYHVVWVEEESTGLDPSGRIGNVWIAHDSTGTDIFPPTRIYELTAAGHSNHDLVDRNSWGPAVDFDYFGTDGQGNTLYRLEVAYTAYDSTFNPNNTALQNVELYVEVTEGWGTNYGTLPGRPWLCKTFPSPTTNVYEHYPDIAVEPWTASQPRPANTYGQIVYDRTTPISNPIYWEVWACTEP
jgi:hypothetical protein